MTLNPKPHRNRKKGHHYELRMTMTTKLFMLMVLFFFSGSTVQALPFGDHQQYFEIPFSFSDGTIL